MSVASQPTPSQIVPTKIGEILGSCQFRPFFWLGLSSQYLRPWQTWARKKRALFKKRETLSKSCTIKNFMAKTLDRKKIVLLLCRTDSRIGGGSPRDPFFSGKEPFPSKLGAFLAEKMRIYAKVQPAAVLPYATTAAPTPPPTPSWSPPRPTPPTLPRWMEGCRRLKQQQPRSFWKGCRIRFDSHMREREWERERERVRKGLREGERVVRKPIMLSLLMIFSSRSFVLSVV